MIDFRTAACTIGVTENELLDLVQEQHVPFRRRARSKAMSLWLRGVTTSYRR